MQRRIFGLETEYGLSFHSSQGPRVSPEEAARQLFKPVVAWGRSSNVFLDNSARLYLDVGSHPEYATAECDSLLDLIRQDRAGDAILGDLLEQAQQSLAAEGYEGRLYLFKNNVDSVGNSYGSHENYLIKRSLDFTRLSKWLIPFLVSRPIITGSGGFAATGAESPGPDAARFVLSPRADHLWEPVSSSTTRSRPMINTRDEPHADAQLYRRLHVISGDSSMSEPTLFLKFGATALVLRLLEAGGVLPDLSISNPLRSLREVSLGVRRQPLIALADGTEMTALQIQEIFVEQLRRLGEREGFSAEEEQVLTLWEAVLDDLRTGSDAVLSTHVDWAIKEKLFARFAARDGQLSAARLRQLDMAYHDVHPQRGLHRLLEARGAVASMVTASEVEDARENAPRTTRASLRGAFLKACRERGVAHTVDWMNLRVNAEPHTAVRLKDPFLTDPSALEEILESVRNSQQG